MPHSKAGQCPLKRNAQHLPGLVDYPTSSQEQHSGPAPSGALALLSPHSQPPSAMFPAFTFPARPSIIPNPLLRQPVMQPSPTCLSPGPAPASHFQPSSAIPSASTHPTSPAIIPDPLLQQPNMRMSITGLAPIPAPEFCPQPLSVSGLSAQHSTPAYSPNRPHGQQHAAQITSISRSPTQAPKSQSRCPSISHAKPTSPGTGSLSKPR